MEEDYSILMFLDRGGCMDDSTNTCDSVAHLNLACTRFCRDNRVVQRSDTKLVPSPDSAPEDAGHQNRQPYSDSEVQDDPRFFRHSNAAANTRTPVRQ